VKGRPPNVVAGKTLIGIGKAQSLVSRLKDVTYLMA